jgi:hypothetical protein
MDEYQIHELSNKQLKLGYWYITHRQRLKKTAVIILGLAAIAIWTVVAFGLVKYLVSLSRDSGLVAEIAATRVDYESFFARNKPQDLVVLPAEVIYNGDSSYDFWTRVTNPNQNRGVARLSYQFVSGNFITATSSVTILPGQSVYLLSLANLSGTRLASARLNIIETRWQSWQAQSVFTENPIITGQPAFYNNLETTRSWVSFTAKNQSIYNFWEVDFQAILFSGSRVIGVNQLNLERFLAGSEREVEISWFERLPRVTKVEIVPIVDVYNRDNFFTLPGEVENFDF